MGLDDTIKTLDKKFGEGTVRPFPQAEYPEVECISTGSLKLDYAIGGNEKLLGIPLGRVSILWGPKGGGKSSLCNHIVGNAQKIGLTVAVIDIEFSFDPRYARNCGVDTESLIWVTPYNKETGETLSAEDLWEITEALIRSGEVGLIVIDSEDTMITRAELDGEFGESFMGKRARLNSMVARRLLGTLKMNNTALVIVKQLRHKIGVVFGDPRTMSGGEAWQHATSLRINISPGKVEKDKGEMTGVNPRCFIKWNKIGSPFKSANLQIRFGEGISLEAELLELGAEIGAYEKRGAYYYFNDPDQYDVQGQANAVRFLKDNPELAERLESEIRGKLQPEKTEEASEQVEHSSQGSTDA